MNWRDVQIYYNEPHTVRDTILYFKLHTVLWKSAVDSGKLIPRTPEESRRISKSRLGKKHTPEIKKLLSEKRKKFLSENPDKHPWRNPKKFISEPCQHLKKIFKEREIKFIEEYQPLLEQGRFYSIDVVIPDKKIGIEINGNQHYNRDGTLKDYYRTRYDLITKNGWNLYEVHYSLVYNSDFVNELIESINTSSPLDHFDYKQYISDKVKKQNDKLSNKKLTTVDMKNSIFDWSSFSKLTIVEIQKITSCKLSSIYSYMNRHGFEYMKSGRPKSLRLPIDKKLKEIEDDTQEYIPTSRKFNPTKEELSKIIWELPYTKVAEHYGVSDVAVRKRAKYYSLKVPPVGYWVRINNGYSHEEALNPISIPQSKSKKLTDEQVREIRLKINNKESMVNLSKEYGFCYYTIKSIKYGWTYANVI